MKRKNSIFLTEPIIKLYSRGITLFSAVLFVHFGMKTHHQIYSFGIKHLIYADGDFASAYCLKNELNFIEKIIMKRMENIKNFSDYFEAKAMNCFQRHLKLVKTLEKKYSSNNRSFTILELEQDYTNFTNLLNKAQAHIWFIFFNDAVIAPIFSKKFRPLLQKEKLPITDDEFFKVISTPLKKTGVINERIELLKLVINRARGKDIHELLVRHTNKWRWFPCYNPSDKPYTIDHYKKEIEQMSYKNAKEELSKIITKQKKDTQQYNKIVSLVKNKELKRLIKFINKISFYREFRNDVRREGMCRVSPLFKRIGSKVGLSVKEVCYLTPNEVVSTIKRRNVLDKAVIRQRMKGYIVVGDQKDFEIITGGRIKKFVKVLLPKSEATELRGIAANNGRVTGHAFVITNLDKLNKIRKGDILVASMTAPEYVVAMRKARAVVTDEGGLMSHAAIISRELGIPCVVGTKIATSIFHDRDLIEVDANKGTVKKL